jgi:hypothetical protein
VGTTYSPQQDSECTISSSLVGERGPDEQNWVHKVIKFRKVLKGLSFEQIIIIAVGKKKTLQGVQVAIFSLLFFGVSTHLKRCVFGGPNDSREWKGDAYLKDESLLLSVVSSCS